MTKLKIIGTITFLLFVIALIWFMSGEGVSHNEDIQWGATFFPAQASALGLDWKEVYVALLDDMGVRNVRLAAPWNNIEREEGVYVFEDIDWMINEAAQRNATITLAVGRKLFRWPECHDPAWARGLSAEQFNERVLRFVAKTVIHMRQFENIVEWQVENEPLFLFGECTGVPPSQGLFEKEIALVAALDARPISTTESGELSAWILMGSKVDRLGVSLYRLTTNPLFGNVYYPFRPGFYYKKAQLTSALNRNLKEVFLSELQLEPWADEPLVGVPLKTQFDRMGINRVRNTIAYAQKTGFGRIYVWGVEWWYWLKHKHYDPRYWDEGKMLMHIE